MLEWFRRLLFGRFYKAQNLITQAAQSYKQYNISHQLPDLEKTIKLYRNAVSESNEQQHDQYTTILINLAVGLTELGEIQSRDSAIDRYSEPIELLSRARRFMETKPAPARPSTYPTVLISLGRLYLNRFRETKSDGDLRASIEAYELVRSSSPSVSSLQYSISLIEQASALWTACELQPKADDALRLEQALTYLNEARQGKHPQLEGECDKHLAAVYDLLYRETSKKDLKKAMTYLHSAIELNQSSVRLLRDRSEDDPALAPTLVNLARQQFARYTAAEVKDEADLKNAEMNYKEARRLAGKEHGGSKELLEKIVRLANDVGQYKTKATFRRGSADQY